MNLKKAVEPQRHRDQRAKHVLAFFPCFTRWVSGEKRGESLFFGLLCASVPLWCGMQDESSSIREKREGKKGTSRFFALLAEAVFQLKRLSCTS
jgi:hypothetical protein